MKRVRSIVDKERAELLQKYKIIYRVDNKQKWMCSRWEKMESQMKAMREVTQLWMIISDIIQPEKIYVTFHHRHLSRRTLPSLCVDCWAAWQVSRVSHSLRKDQSFSLRMCIGCRNKWFSERISVLSIHKAKIILDRVHVYVLSKRREKFSLSFRELCTDGDLSASILSFSRSSHKRSKTEWSKLFIFVPSVPATMMPMTMMIMT